MFLRMTRWTAAFIVACAMTSVGCGRAARSHEWPGRAVTPSPEDDSVVHAFDTEMAVRLLDRLELDRSLRDRNIRLRIVDGTVSVMGYVWSSGEKARVTELIRGVPGVTDVANELDIRPPR
jgi:osmotically-inducible protein OsmY